MKKIFIFLSAVFMMIAFNTFCYAKSISLKPDNFNYHYLSFPDHGGPYTTLDPDDSFTFAKGKVHVFVGNVSDPTNYYASVFNPKLLIDSRDDFRIELSFKNLVFNGTGDQELQFGIGDYDALSITKIGISSDGIYYTWCEPLYPGGLNIAANSDSGTFILEKEGDFITLSVKGVNNATWTYNKTDHEFDLGERLEIQTDIFAGTGGDSLEVDITGVKVKIFKKRR